MAYYAATAYIINTANSCSKNINDDELTANAYHNIGDIMACNIGTYSFYYDDFIFKKTPICSATYKKTLQK